MHSCHDFVLIASSTFSCESKQDDETETGESDHQYDSDFEDVADNESKSLRSSLGEVEEEISYADDGDVTFSDNDDDLLPPLNNVACNSNEKEIPSSTDDSNDRIKENLGNKNDEVNFCCDKLGKIESSGDDENEENVTEDITVGSEEMNNCDEYDYVEIISLEKEENIERADADMTVEELEICDLDDCAHFEPLLKEKKEKKEKTEKESQFVRRPKPGNNNLIWKNSDNILLFPFFLDIW